MVLVRVWIWLSFWLVASGKVYRRCDLVKELRNFDVPEEEIATWVCIARYESNYNTSAMNPGSGDHGLFQISQLYWLVDLDKAMAWHGQRFQPFPLTLLTEKFLLSLKVKGNRDLPPLAFN